MARQLDEQGIALLDAASALLSTEGAAAITVRRIAAEAGCSTMGVYSRFGGKDGVVDELYKEGFRRLTEGMDATETDDPVGDLHRCGLAYRRYALDNPTYYLVMFGGAVPGFQPSEDAKKVGFEAFGRLVHRVRRCQEAGRFAEGSPEAMAEVMWGAIHGHVMLELVGMKEKYEGAADRYERTLQLIEQGFAASQNEA